jgi:hypothetical protein
MSSTNVNDQTQTLDAPTAPGQAAVSPGTSQPTAENKEQLHRRVEKRLAELTAAREKLTGQDGNRERAQAIETELQVARGSMSGGWDRIGQMEAAQLSQWLTKTEQLISKRPAAADAAAEASAR